MQEVVWVQSQFLIGGNHYVNASVKNDIELFAGVTKSEEYFILMAMPEFETGKEVLYCFGAVRGKGLHECLMILHNVIP